MLKERKRKKMNTKEFNARVWSLEKSKVMKNTYTANVSTYEGEDKNGDPIFCYWSGRFVGEAFKKARGLEEGEKIGITNASVTTYYDKDKKKLYANLTIFDFDEPFEYKGKNKK